MSSKHFNRPNPNPSLLLSWYLCWTESCPTLWTPWTVAHQVLSMGLPRQEYWSGLPFSRASSQPRDQTHVSCIGRQVLYLQSHLEAPREGRVPGLSEESTPFPKASVQPSILGSSLPRQQATQALAVSSLLAEPCYPVYLALSFMVCFFLHLSGPAGPHPGSVRPADVISAEYCWAHAVDRSPHKLTQSRAAASSAL